MSTPMTALTPIPVSRAVGVPAWRVPSRSHPGHQHTVTRLVSGGLLCTCTAASFGQRCAHVRAVAELVVAQPVTHIAPEDEMTYDTSLTLTSAPSVAPTLPPQGEWATIVQMSTTLANSGLMPAHVKSPEAAAAIILQGRELGIGAMQALRTIYLISGRLTLAADLMAALIYRACGDRALQVRERTAKRCVIAYQRPGWSEPVEMVWTMEMAIAAKLTGKDNWQHHPDAMLFARCISAIAHTAFQDVIMGMYTADEAEEIAAADPPTLAAGAVTVTKVSTPSAYELSGKREPTTPAAPAVAGYSVTATDPRPTKEQAAAYKAAAEQAVAASRWTKDGVLWLMKGLYSKHHFSQLTGEQTDVIRLAITDWTEAELRQMVTDLFGFDWAHAVLTGDQHRRMLEILHGAIAIGFDAQGRYKTGQEHENDRRADDAAIGQPGPDFGDNH